MSRLRKLGSGLAVILLGCLSLLVPVFDAVDDVITQGASPVSAAIENIPLVALGLVIVALGVWLIRSDWNSTYTWTVARLSLSFTLGVAALVVLVVFIQSQVQANIKPLIIAADGIIVGAVGGVLLGIRTAQQERAAEKAAAQRDRFQALFENVPNPIVGVEFVDDDPIVRAVNPAFTEVFGFDPRTIRGKNLEQYIVPPNEELNPIDHTLSPPDPDDQDAWDSNVIKLETVDGRREFIRLSAPVDRGPARDGYAIYIDVTVQRQRRERLRVLSRTLRHDIRNRVTTIQGLEPIINELDDDHREAVERAVDSAEELHEMAEKTHTIEQQIAGESTLNPRDLGEVVPAVVENVRPEYPNATINVTAPDAIYGDVTQAFSEAIAGIVRNGVEHNDSSEPTVEVTVTESLDEEYVAVQVADDGSGIDPEQAKIAEGIVETDQKTTHLNGLGLWTARWAVQNSGGELEFGANSPRGTTVTIKIPRSDSE